ncbi:hypothetical protein BLNAU_18179 [Blattamonas nauphoetae]|uniref:Uncharacterized protein n=1 Tax=Blattamonas nauphoetae TaxID=2049346 RepID=A0ABQ9X545_9EUKA|nr:hypothetical protein BLNAU_18179 [Blattamonas nauphoetae]
MHLHPRQRFPVRFPTRKEIKTILDFAETPIQALPSARRLFFGSDGPRNRCSAHSLHGRLASFADGSSTNSIPSIGVLISSADQIVANTTMPSLKHITQHCPDHLHPHLELRQLMPMDLCLRSFDFGSVLPMQPLRSPLRPPSRFPPLLDQNGTRQKTDCLASFECDPAAGSSLNSVYGASEELGKQNGIVGRMKTTLHSSLMLEGLDDVSEKRLQHGKEGCSGGHFGFYSITFCSQQDMNLPDIYGFRQEPAKTRTEQHPSLSSLGMYYPCR